METIEAGAVSLALVVGSVTDLKERVIPDLVTLPAAGVIGVTALLSGPPFEALLAGAITSALICLPLGALSVLRPGSFGMGDVKLIAVMALAAGPVVWVPLLPALGLATGYGLVRSRLERTTPGQVSLPLAPFLALPGVAFFAFAGFS